MLERTVFKREKSPRFPQHGDLIDLLPEDHVLVMKPVFQPLDFLESLF